MIEEQILSKMLDENNINQVLKFNVQKDDFPTLGDVFEYIVDYRRAHGAVPDYRTVAGEYAEFDYQPGIQEPFSGLCKRLKVQSAKRRSFEMLQNEAGAKYKELSGDKFVDWMEENIAKIKKATSSDFSVGTNIAVNGEERRERYQESKENRTFSYIPTPYESLTRFLGGGFELGDYILLEAFTNRGKSWIASHIGQAAWRAKFGVLHYSPELSKAQQTSRFETLDGHFNNSDLRRGQLSNESEYFGYLEGFDGSHETPYIVKTMEDLPNGLTTDVIEADLEMNPDVKLIVIDGFSLMSHKGGGKSNRDAMTNTSRRLRQIFGRYGVAGLIVHQVPGSAEKDNKEVGDNGVRIVKPPSIEQYSETIAVIQDAATVLTFDAHDGIGKLLIAKAREPHVGEIIDLRCDFNMGYIEEPQLTDQFL